MRCLQVAFGGLVFVLAVLAVEPHVAFRVAAALSNVGIGKWKTGKVGELPTSLYDLSAPLLGKTESTSLGTFRGKVMLISNVAIKCGLARRHFSEFQELQSKYGDRGFVVLAFPSNEFSWTTSYLKDFEKYVEENKLTYVFFNPVVVNGDEADPIFQLLKQDSNQFGNETDKVAAVGWNFGKFLVNREGKVVGYFTPGTNPLAMEADILAALEATTDSAVPGG